MTANTLERKPNDLLPDKELGDMVLRYRETGDQFIFSDIKNNLDRLLKQIARKEFNKSSGLAVDLDEFVQYAYIGLMKAVDSYNSDYGSNFVAYVTQHVKWSIQDNIYKKQSTNKEVFYKDSLSLDYEYGSDGGTFLDSVGDQLASDPDEVFNTVMQDMDQENSLLNQLNNLIESFAEENEGDCLMVRAVIAIILSDATLTAKGINEQLYLAFPDVKSATVRKRKSRAMQRFTEFAVDQGLSLDLSQF